MDNFEALLKKEKPNLTETSVKVYVSCWSSLKKLFEQDDNSIEFLLQPKSVIKKLEDKYDKLNSIKLKLACIVVILKTLDAEKYADEIKEYNLAIDAMATQINRKTAMNKKTESQKDNWTTEDEMKTIEDYLLSKVPSNFVIKSNSQMIAFRNYVLFVLQNFLGTRNDLAKAKIMFRPKKPEDLDTETNYILLKKSGKKVSYLMNNYKTDKKMGVDRK